PDERQLAQRNASWPQPFNRLRRYVCRALRDQFSGCAAFAALRIVLELVPFHHTLSLSNSSFRSVPTEGMTMNTRRPALRHREPQKRIASRLAAPVSPSRPLKKLGR